MIGLLFFFSSLIHRSEPLNPLVLLPFLCIIPPRILLRYAVLIFDNRRSLFEIVVYPPTNHFSSPKPSIFVSNSNRSLVRSVIRNVRTPNYTNAHHHPRRANVVRIQSNDSVIFVSIRSWLPIARSHPNVAVAYVRFQHRSNRVRSIISANAHWVLNEFVGIISITASYPS